MSEGPCLCQVYVHVVYHCCRSTKKWFKKSKDQMIAKFLFQVVQKAYENTILDIEEDSQNTHSL